MATDANFDATVARLVAAGCIAAADEASELLAAAADAATLDAMIERREQGEPLAWITGSLTFGGRLLHVAPGVYVPRFQTEELARRAAELLPHGGRALDLCTGAGAIAAHLQATVPSATVIGLDRDERSAACARRNGVATVVADVSRPLPLRAGTAGGSGGGFDVVTAVAPYVPTDALRLLPSDVQRHEPRLALDGGSDGLDLVRLVVTSAACLLRAGGWLLVEVGGDQDDALAPSLAAAGFEQWQPWRDDDGDLRGILARRAQPN